MFYCREFVYYIAHYYIPVLCCTFLYVIIYSALFCVIYSGDVATEIITLAYFADIDVCVLIADRTLQDTALRPLRRRVSADDQRQGAEVPNARNGAEDVRAVSSRKRLVQTVDNTYDA